MGKITYEKCRCGDPVCKQYILSNQGSVGFTLEDARLFAAAPELFRTIDALAEKLWLRSVGLEG